MTFLLIAAFTLRLVLSAFLATLALILTALLAALTLTLTLVLSAFLSALTLTLIVAAAFLAALTLTLVVPLPTFLILAILIRILLFLRSFVRHDFLLKFSYYFESASDLYFLPPRSPCPCSYFIF